MPEDVGVPVPDIVATDLAPVLLGLHIVICCDRLIGVFPADVSDQLISDSGGRITMRAFHDVTVVPPG